MTDIASKISPEEMAQLRQQLFQDIKGQVIEDLKSEEDKRRESLVKSREDEKAKRASYVARMKESTDPWVDILGFVHTDQGVKIELEWNDAFVLYLRNAGLVGTDDETIVQKWVTLLLRDMADGIEEELPETPGRDYV